MVQLAENTYVQNININQCSVLNKINSNFITTLTLNAVFQNIELE